jgi:hypothetical protein
MLVALVALVALVHRHLLALMVYQELANHLCLMV